MSQFLDGFIALPGAVISLDWFSISEAVSHPSAYLWGVLVTLGGGWLLMLLLRALPILDRHLERSVLIVTYLTVAAIIFVEVIRRFIFKVQAPWSTTLPPYLFLIMTWVGCAYNTRLRTHLSFTEFRANLSRPLQFACLWLDAILWLVFALVVIVTTFRQVANSGANFQILLGTDNLMQWWFYICVPISWLMLSSRVIENLLQDCKNYRTGKPMITSNTIGGE